MTSIDWCAFYGCAGLTSITIPDSVTSIGYGAFEECKIKELIIAEGSKTVTSTMVVCKDTLERVTISYGVTDIGYAAFEGCTGLTSITIPDSVTSIGSWAFYGCSSLSDVYCLGAAEQWNSISIGEGNDPLNNATIHYVDFVYGDVNGDGRINNKDLSLLMQYVNGWVVEIDVTVADVNADGLINNKDFSLLMQYINGWDVVLG